MPLTTKVAVSRGSQALRILTTSPCKPNREACLSQQMLSVSWSFTCDVLPKDGGICDVLPIPENCDKERVVTVAPVCAWRVSVCPDAGP